MKEKKKKNQRTFTYSLHLSKCCGEISRAVASGLQRVTRILEGRISGSQGIGDGNDDQDALPGSGT